MPIPTNRFKILDEEFDVPSGSFNNTPPTPKAIQQPTTTQETTTTQTDTTSKRINTIIQDENSILGDLPVVKGDTDKKVVKDILNDVGKSATTGKPLSTAITGTLEKTITPEVRKAYNKVNNHNPPSIAGNKIKVKPKGQLGCEVDIDSLLKSLGYGKSMAGIGLLALLNKLLCAGISNGLSILIDNVSTDTKTKKLLADAALGRAAKKGDFGTVIDVASKDLGYDLKKEGKNVAKSAMSSLHKHTADKFSFSTVDDTLSTLDPDWGNGDFGSVADVPQKAKDNYVRLAATQSRSTPATTSATARVSDRDKKAMSVKHSQPSILDMISNTTRSVLQI